MSGPVKRKIKDTDAARSSKKNKASANGAKKGVAGSSEPVGKPNSKLIEDAEDLNNLKASFRSSLFRLQVAELLKEVRVDYKKTGGVEDDLVSLKNFLEQLPADEVSHDEALPFLEAVGVKYEGVGFTFQKPASVTVGGSYPLHLVAKPEQNVDVIVEIPKTLFRQKDFLNFKYHAKRVLYLAALATHLRTSGQYVRVEWSTLRGDPLKPILLLAPNVKEKGASSEFVIRVLPCISNEVFPLAKLGPQRSNVRSATPPDGSVVATPRYNSGIAEDMCLLDWSPFMETALSTCPALNDAILLLKVWGRQRELTAQPDGLNGFLLSLLAAHLTTAAGGHRVLPHMTSYQPFRCVLEYIGSGSLRKKGAFLQGSGVKPETASEMLSGAPVVICGPNGAFNLAAHVSSGAINELELEAVQTLALLRAEEGDAFAAVFLTKADFAAKFDCHTSFIPPPPKQTHPKWGDTGVWEEVERKVERVLTRGLGPRAKLVRVLRRSWQPGGGLEQCLEALEQEAIRVGVLLSEPEIFLRQADVGPSADKQPESKEFRAFWGSKAELRRFKDGTITETAVWDCATPKRHLIVGQVVRHLLHLHLQAPPASVGVTGGQLDEVLLQDGEDPVAAVPLLLTAYQTLSKALRDLKDLPLAVVGVQPMGDGMALAAAAHELCTLSSWNGKGEGAALTHTAVFPPQPHPLAEQGGGEGSGNGGGSLVHMEPVEIAVQLEGSGKWPDAPEAIQRAKLAFLLHLGQSVEAVHGAPCVAAEDAVDVLWAGFAFRMSIAYDRDPTLLKSAALLPALRPPSTPRQLAADVALRSLHAGLMLSLQGHHPIFAPIARLAKRWVGAHMLAPILCTEAVELLVASLFTRPDLYSVPRSRVTGLLRFLRLVGRHKWRSAPLVVDVNHDLSLEEKRGIQEEFEKVRTRGGGPPLFLCTPYDRHSGSWSCHTPSPEGLKRLVAYARSSALLLTNLVQDPGKGRWQTLFCTPLPVYDALLLLDHRHLPNPTRILFPAGGPSPRPPRGLPSLAPRTSLLIGFNPRDVLVQKLQEEYGEVAEFWVDPLAGDAVGVTWKRSEAKPRVGTLLKAMRITASGLLTSIQTFPRK